MRRLRRTAIAFTVVALVGAVLVPAGTLALLARGPWGSAGQVTVTPGPGSVVPQDSRIVFRGVPADRMNVTVSGSSSGFHLGILRPHHDRLGTTFVPDRQFTAGETVTVSTGWNVRGAPDGKHHFTVAAAAPC